jgi:hypothetical protein
MFATGRNFDFIACRSVTVDDCVASISPTLSTRERNAPMDSGDGVIDISTVKCRFNPIDDKKTPRGGHHSNLGAETVCRFETRVFHLALIGIERRAPVNMGHLESEPQIGC